MTPDLETNRGGTLDEIAGELGSISGVEVTRDVPAATLCTYRAGGPLAIHALIENHEALAEVASLLSDTAVETLPIGKGSNLLVADAGFDGVALVLGDGFTDISIDGTTVTAGGAASLPVVARATVAAGLHGFGWAVGVPGSIGGAVRMNAGGHGADMSESLNSVRVGDLALGGLLNRSVDSLDLGYRSSNLEPWHIVADATLDLEMVDEAGTGQDSSSAAAEIDSDTRLRSIVSWRRENQPGGANAGSVFTNPAGDSAGRLIDAAGLKGTRVGSAEVSTKHANFIQVDAEGRADDVMALMAQVVDRVWEHAGVKLHAETRLIGFSPSQVAQVAPDVGTQSGASAKGNAVQNQEGETP